MGEVLNAAFQDFSKYIAVTQCFSANRSL